MAKTPAKSEDAAPAAAPAPAPAAPANRELRYEDRPDLQETFVDQVQRMTVDGRTLRIEFCVTRMDEPTPEKPRAGRSIPICRLVLDLDGAVDMFNKMNNLQAALENRGVIRKT